MEGTSGAAESGSLRGESGEAALGPGCVGLRKRVGCICADWDAQHLRKQVFVLSWLDCWPRESGLCGGHISLMCSRLLAGAGLVRRNRRRHLVRLRLGGVVEHRQLQPVFPRFCDMRCPSGSGWGEAPPSRLVYERGWWEAPVGESRPVPDP